MPAGRSPRGHDDPFIAPPTKDLTRVLTADEHLQLNVHQHPMVLWKPVALLAGALALLVVVLSDNRLPLLVVVIVLAALGNLAWRVYERRHNSFAATDRRILRVEGVLNKSVPMMRLQKITDMRLDQPLIGRFIGYGTITIESAGQDQAVRELAYAPNPTLVFRRLNSVIFGEEHPDLAAPVRPAPARRAVSATARGMRRSADVARREANRAAGRTRLTQSQSPTPGQIGSPVADRAKHHFFGAIERPDDDTDEIPIQPPRTP